MRSSAAGPDRSWRLTLSPSAAYLVPVAAEITPEPTFEQIIARLEAIASQLERGEVPLEESLRLFEEGVSLAKKGASRLDGAERRIATLLEDGTTAPLPTETNS